MSILDYIKLGFGFYIGYEIASTLDDLLGNKFKN